ncbi:DJ-1/PfpI family protein [Jeotgalibaca sp. A127]|uniref:DJ-1/PfpI family protein n=1 Tax=Jeotgalibaca sp. A127 TaxID=3457324 RepID=UPI003FD1417E
MEKVLFIIAPDDFQDEELFWTQQELKDCGYETWIASHKADTCRGVNGGIAQSDMVLEDVDTNDFEAVIFVGGKGSRVFFSDPHAYKIAQAMHGLGKTIAAISIAPVILANAGILKKRYATVSESESKTLESKGVHYSNEGVVVDGNIVTAAGLRNAKEFGQKVCERLSKRD